MDSVRPPSPRLVPCPRCGAPSEFAPSNRFRPFCSERCRSADLGAWASEQYRVAAPATPEPDDDAPPSSSH
ncbi:MAG: DNA gyrase inhibitor YacG [Pseudomonadota bacterium]